MAKTMAGRYELMICTTIILTLAFIMSSVSTGTNSWIGFEQSAKDPTIIFFRADQGLFEQCILRRHRSRVESHNCYSLSRTYNKQSTEGWEKAVAGLMVTSAVLMGLAVLLGGYLMLSDHERTGILSDVSPVIIGNIAAIISLIALIIYNSKYESIRKKLMGGESTDYTDTEVDFGYSFYIGWLACFLHFFNIFFFFIYKAWVKHSIEQRKRKGQQFRMTQQRL